jgi:hypothetical protein
VAIVAIVAKMDTNICAELLDIFKCPITDTYLDKPIITFEGIIYNKMEDDIMNNGVRNVKLIADIVEILLKHKDNNDININKLINDLDNYIRCPISYLYFLRPVLADDDHVYEEDFIKQHLITDNRSPMTRKKISNNLIYVNIVSNFIGKLKELCPDISSDIYYVSNNFIDNKMIIIKILCNKNDNEYYKLYKIINYEIYGDISASYGCACGNCTTTINFAEELFGTRDESLIEYVLNNSIDIKDKKINLIKYLLKYKIDSSKILQLLINIGFELDIISMIDSKLPNLFKYLIDNDHIYANISYIMTMINKNIFNLIIAKYPDILSDYNVLVSGLKNPNIDIAMICLTKITIDECTPGTYITDMFDNIINNKQITDEFYNILIDKKIGFNNIDHKILITGLQSNNKNIIKLCISYLPINIPTIDILNSMIYSKYMDDECINMLIGKQFIFNIKDNEQLLINGLAHENNNIAMFCLTNLYIDENTPVFDILENLINNKLLDEDEDVINKLIIKGANFDKKMCAEIFVTYIKKINVPCSIRLLDIINDYTLMVEGMNLIQHICLSCKADVIMYAIACDADLTIPVLNFNGKDVYYLVSNLIEMNTRLEEDECNMLVDMIFTRIYE